MLLNEEVSTILFFFSNSEHNTLFDRSTPNVSSGPVQVVGILSGSKLGSTANHILDNSKILLVFADFYWVPVRDQIGTQKVVLHCYPFLTQRHLAQFTSHLSHHP